MAAGIYKILCMLTTACYVGSSDDMDAEWKSHLRDLRRNKHPNKALQKAWNDYGEPAFEFDVLETTSVSDLQSREKYYVDQLKPSLNAEKVQRKVRARSPRKTTTVRLEEKFLSQLAQASWIFGKTQSDVVQDALEEYFAKYHLAAKYQLHVTEDSLVLMKLSKDGPPQVVEVTKRNGAGIDRLVDEYRTRLQEPVEVVLPQPPPMPKNGTTSGVQGVVS